MRSWHLTRTPRDFFRGLVIVAAAVLVPGFLSPAPATQRVNLEAYPKLDPDDLPEAQRRWIEEEVRWIITDDEREVFLRLDSDPRRDLFVREFWNHRDPSPGTVANEYRDQHYERLEYASENFGRGSPRPGWDTDQGRVWILLGRPRSFNRLPNTSLAVPVEVWFYSVDPAIGLPPFFYLIFFKDRGVGSYRLYSPAMDGPSRLLNASGKQQAARGGGDPGPGARTLGLGEGAGAIRLLRQVDVELARAASSLIPGEGGQMVSPLRSEMVLARVFGLPSLLMPQATWAYNVLTGLTESKVRFETLPLRAAAVVLFDPSGIPFIHFATRTRGERLNLNQYEDRYYVTFQISSSVRDGDLRFLQAAEPRLLQADLDEETARRLRTGPVQYMERLPAITGEYTLALMLENNVTHEFGRAEFDLRVPDLETTSLTSSTPLLVSQVRDTDPNAYDPFVDQVAFQLGPRLLVPAVGGPFPEGGTVRVLWQLIVPSEPQPLLASYRLRDTAGKLLIEKVLRIDPGQADDNRLLNHLAAIDLRDVPPGPYVLTADLEGDDRDPIELSVEVVPQHQYVEPFIHARHQPPATSSQVRLVRARQLRTVGRTDEAITQLDSVLRREPDMEEALELQLDLLTDAGRYQEIEELLTPRLVRAPKNVDLLLQLAEVEAQLGRHHDAIRYYERARLEGAEQTPELLNALASEYYAQGRLEPVATLLQRSLDLRPQQPQIRKLLDEVRARQ